MPVELTESQINGRFKIVERPVALPGKCAVCGAVDKPCIDFGFDLNRYGVVYFCIDCITECASILGMVDGKLLETARLVQQDLNDKISEAGELVSEYFKRINDLHADFVSHFGSESRSVILSVDEATGETTPDDSGDVRKAATTNKSTSRQSCRATIDEGTVSVPSGASNESGVFNF